MLDVIIDSAGSKSSSSDKSQISTEPVLGPQISAMDADLNADSVLDASAKVNDSSKPTPSGNKECQSQQVLSTLPRAELRLLCSLLALEGYDYGLMLCRLCQLFCLRFVNMPCFGVSSYHH